MSDDSHDRSDDARRGQLLRLRGKLQTCLGIGQPASGPFELGPCSSGSAADADVAKTVREEIQRRAKRCQLFPDEIFGEPAWNILLDLYLSASINRRVTVSDACIASKAPKSTALRWIDLLIEWKLVERRRSDFDQRVVYLQLTAETEQKIIAYFDKG